MLLLLPTVTSAQQDAVLPAVDSSLEVPKEMVPSDAAKQMKLRPSVWAAIADDTIPDRVQTFDPDAIGVYKADPDLDYDRELHVQQLWWDRLKEWISDRIRDLFGTEAGEWTFGHLHWLILALAVGFLLFFFRKRLFHGVFTVDAMRGRQVLEMEEDIAQLDLDSLLAAAEKVHNWRLALRYRYLIVLRHMVDKGLIIWQPRNTDRDYLHQLKDPVQRATFSELSFLFKWAWYGDAPMDEQRYRELAPLFERFQITLSAP